MRKTNVFYFVMFLQFFSYSLLGYYTYILISDKSKSEALLFVIPILFTYLFEKLYEGHNRKYCKKVQEIELKNIQAINTYMISVMVILVITSFNGVDVMKWARAEVSNFWVYALSALITSAFLSTIFNFTLPITKVNRKE